MILNGINWKEKNLSNTNPINPRRGEIWDVNFDSTVESEVQNICPTVVISSDNIGDLPIRVILPIIDWRDQFLGNVWHVYIKPNDTNGLTKASAVDALQIRGVDVRRFIRRIGRLNATLMEDIVAATTTIIERE